jgi:hypothetical protein
MRRQDREIREWDEIRWVMEKAEVCRIGLSEDHMPYVVPVHFGYSDHRLYFHSAPEGKKIEILKRNDRICFEIDLAVELVRGETLCKWDAKYWSVIGFGRAFLVSDTQEKRRGLDAIVVHYHGSPHAYSEEELGGVAVVRIEIEKVTGKKSGY